MAYVTGVLLLVLVLVAMPMKYLGDDGTLVSVVGIAHGWIYILYVLAAGVLCYKARWGLGRSLLVVLAGTVPFASFVAERKVVHALTPAGPARTGAPAA
ncbi:DUF3817 domain-containing protein [Vallicoccus soli]|uniref:DUF3817 domain-containing protein n=2 Tax=Vallicoccus soli TaxID=2339232 RepID=A0A3A3ZKR5_9ACTN|nr:DUF3817 domain-containing protein [Vallicoccus soli]